MILMEKKLLERFIKRKEKKKKIEKNRKGNQEKW